jgi:hypothetical protein
MQSITEQRRFRLVNKKKEVAGMNPPIGAQCSAALGNEKGSWNNGLKHRYRRKKGKLHIVDLLFRMADNSQRK